MTAAGAPLVSVVVPVRDEERFLAQALESVAAQTHEPVEVIVVDDGSRDRSTAIARSFPGVRVLEQAPAGPGAARNRGIAAARGELLTFFDADDLMLPEKLERQAAHLLAHPETGCVLCRHEVFTEDGGEPPAWAVAPPAWLARNPALEGRGILQPLSALARREVVEAVGPFSESFGEDLDWLCRVFEAGVRVESVDAVLLRKRIHDANLTHDLGSSRRAMFRALRDHAARTVKATP